MVKEYSAGVLHDAPDIPCRVEKDKAVIDLDEQREWIRRVRRCAEGMESEFSRRSAEAEAQRIEMFIAEVERLRARVEQLESELKRYTQTLELTVEPGYEYTFDPLSDPCVVKRGIAKKEDNDDNA